MLSCLHTWWLRVLKKKKLRQKVTSLSTEESPIDKVTELRPSSILNFVIQTLYVKNGLSFLQKCLQSPISDFPISSINYFLDDK